MKKQKCHDRSSFNIFWNNRKWHNSKDGRTFKKNQNQEILLKYFEETISTLRDKGKHVVIFSPTPSNGENIGLCLSKAELFDSNRESCIFLIDDMEKSRQTGFKLLKQISKNTPVVWLDKLICEGKICNFYQDNTIIYMDSGHLSKEGSRYIGKKYSFFDLAIGNK